MLLSTTIINKNFIKFVNSIKSEIIQKPFICNSQNVYINVTLGFAQGKKEQLLINANMALERAKKLKKDYEIFDDTIELSKI